MTEPYQSPYQPPSLPPPPAPLSAYISWAIIIVSVLAIFAANNLLGPRRPVAGAPGADTADAELRIASRMALGMKAMSAVSSQQQAQSQTPDYAQMIRQVRISSPTDRLRRTMMLAELSDQKKPTELLDEFESTNPPKDLRADAEALRIIYTRGPDILEQSAVGRLINRHGWYAHVALAYGKPANDPQRQAATIPAVRTFLAVIVFFLFAIGAFFLGLMLLIIAAVRLKQGKLRMNYVPPQRSAYLLLECFAWYIGLFTGIGFILRLAGVRAPAWEWLALAGPVVVAFIWPMIRGVPWAQVRSEIGLTRGRGIATEIVSGLAGWIAAVPVIAVAFVLTLILSRYFNHMPTHPIQRDIRPGLSLLYVYILACVWAPIIEEIFFRGMLFQYMRGILRWLASAIITSLIFAAIHPQGVLGIPALATIAMTLAALREWRGSLVASMAAHALNNFIAVTFVALVFL